jgi:HTH-like domain
VRPATALICQFIDEKKEEFGVAPICRALSAHGVQIAPRTYWARLAAAPGKRQLWDTAVTEILAGIYEPGEHGRRPPESLYGTVKMWAWLNRQGIPVARCTIERLKRRHGWWGATRARRVRTTVPDPAASRAPDLVGRNFKAARPGQLHVADFTYVPLAGGRFGYTAFVIDAFAGLIPGWECSLPEKTAFVESAIRQAAAYRARQGHPITGDAIHHSDAGIHGPGIPGCLPAAGYRPVDGPPRVGAGQRGHRIVALHLRIRAAASAALRHQGTGPHSGGGLDRGLQHPAPAHGLPEDAASGLRAAAGSPRGGSLTMTPPLPPASIRRCSAKSRSFLLGPDGPAGGSTWTAPALRRSYRATGEPGPETRSVLQSLHGSRGTPTPMFVKSVAAPG